MAHVMVDLETWGTHAGAAIRSIGACMFDPVKGTIEQTFYMNITDAFVLGRRAGQGTPARSSGGRSRSRRWRRRPWNPTSGRR